MKESFLNNIRRGLGSAYIELRDSYNKNEYLDTLIFACVHDSSYELMIEGPKGQYLFSLIKLFDIDTQKKIEMLIIESLSIKDSRALIFQKLDILESFYYEVDKNCAEVILNFCNKFMNETKKWDEHRQSAFEIVAIIMDRLFGLKQTKLILKFIQDKKLNEDNFGWYFYRLNYKYKKNEYIKQIIEKTNDKEEKEEKVFTLEKLLACNDKFYISCYAHRIDEKEFNNTISFLKTTDDIDQIKKVLSAYSEEYANKQLTVDLCFWLLDKYGEKIEYEIYDVVEHYKSPLVEDLALKLIKNNKYLTKALVMLFNNYSKKYLNLIVDTYKRIKFSFYKYDSITHETINFLNHKKKNYPDDILFINYQKSYDSFCREYIVDIMKKRNLLTPSIIQECQHDFDYELNKKAQKWKKKLDDKNDLSINKIIDCVPNKTIRSYLRQSKADLSVMQLATLVDNFCSNDYVENMNFLIAISTNEYEKKLFEIAIKDYEKYKCIDEKTSKYYSKNDSRKIKPLCPFQEYIELPRLLNDYDVGKCTDGRIVVVGKIDKTKYAEAEFGDLSYMVYDLDNEKALSKDTLFKIHEHIHYCEISKIDDAELSEKQRNRYNELVAYMKENGF